VKCILFCVLHSIRDKKRENRAFNHEKYRYFGTKRKGSKKGGGFILKWRSEFVFFI